MKFLWMSICLLLLLGTSWYCYQTAIFQSLYEGLPTVACIDPTESIEQTFSLHIIITIDNKNYPLSPAIGHDYGHCLHDIFTNDASGTVYIQANHPEQFTLGQFFDVWKKTFNNNQIFGYQRGNDHILTVIVNGKKVNTYRQTILRPNQTIDVRYQ